MAWNESAVTQSGIEKLNESLAGYALTITHAVGGAGTTDAAELENATGVAEEKQTLTVPGIEDNSSGSGKKVRIQITNEDVEETYYLHQIGVYAKLSYEDEASLLFILQDERGVEIPSYSENPDFLLEIFAVLDVSNEADISVTVDSSAVVSRSTAEGIANSAVSAHNTESTAHADIRASLETLQKSVAAAVQSAQDAANAAKENAESIGELEEKQSSLSGGMVTLTTIEFSLLPSAWAKDEAETGRYPYQATYTDSAVNASVYPEVTLDITSTDVAYTCGLCTVVQATEDGELIFLAQSAPTDTISGICKLWTAGSKEE